MNSIGVVVLELRVRTNRPKCITIALLPGSEGYITPSGPTSNGCDIFSIVWIMNTDMCNGKKILALETRAYWRIMQIQCTVLHLKTLKSVQEMHKKQYIICHRHRGFIFKSISSATFLLSIRLIFLFVEYSIAIKTDLAAACDAPVSPATCSSRCPRRVVSVVCVSPLAVSALESYPCGPRWRRSAPVHRCRWVDGRSATERQRKRYTIQYNRFISTFIHVSKCYILSI